MKSILDENHRNVIISRINNIKPESKGLWGKMNVTEMLCHTADQIRMSTGDIKTKFVGNFFTKTIGKFVVLAGAPAPKGKIETVKELKQGVGGTKPVEFEKDKEELVKLILTFSSQYPDDEKIIHPAFGPMTKEQWGKLGYTHLDHHLKQFGV